MAVVAKDAMEAVAMVARRIRVVLFISLSLKRKPRRKTAAGKRV